MTYELVLAVAPPDTPDPVERACELMDPFIHCEETCRRWQEEYYDEEDAEPCHGEHFWDRLIVGGRSYFSGCLWRDRKGLLLPDHPITIPRDEVGRVSDLNLRFLYLSPTGPVGANGHVYFMAKPRVWPHTIARFMTYRGPAREYPDHLAVPMACHS